MGCIMRIRPLLLLPLLLLLPACDEDAPRVTSGGPDSEVLPRRIQILPADPVLEVDRAQRFVAWGLFPDGSHRDISAQVTWSSEDPSRAHPEGDRGLFRGGAEGRVSIQAVLDGVAGATEVQVFNTLASGMGPLTVHPDNPRYFADGEGRPVLLTGSHTWLDFQDAGNGNPPPVFDYPAWLRFLRDRDHSFFRLWIWEQSRWTLETTDDEYWFHPDTPYLRTGPGTALDGLPKFDLDRLDPAWFDRLRARVVQARSCGLYVAVGLFNGWSVASAKGVWDVRNPWLGHPFHRDNNVNGVDGDTNGDDSGVEVHELDDAAVLAYQEAYVRRTIESLNDLDNVLWEISNESHDGSIAWQYRMIDFIRSVEAGLPLQHPVGMSVVWPDGDNGDLLASPADWIAPNGSVLDPPEVDGTKVLVDDIDHLCGICGDRDWVWKSFLRGRNPVFMDGYDGAGYGVGGEGFVFDDPAWVGLRASMGYANAFARRLDLARVVPHGELASTGYCLARPHASEGEWLVYLDGGGDVQVDLSASARLMQVEWFDPETGTSQPGDPVMGGKLAVMTPPFSGDAVLYIH